jgi:hypothetical protein
LHFKDQNDRHASLVLEVELKQRKQIAAHVLVMRDKADPELLASVDKCVCTASVSGLSYWHQSWWRCKT